MSAGDALKQVISEAVEAGLRKALNVNPATNRRLLSIEEAALYLSLSEREVYSMIANRELPVVQHGRRKMLDILDLNTWIDQKKVGTGLTP